VGRGRTTRGGRGINTVAVAAEEAWRGPSIGLRRGSSVASTVRRRFPIARAIKLVAAFMVATAAPATPATTTADARGVDCPDPTLLVENPGPAAVTLMCTGDGFPTRAASTIRGLWGAIPRPAFAPDGWPQWADGGFWAPDLERVADDYLLYYSAKRKGDHRRCIGVAISDTPDGGFRDIGHPLVSNQRFGAIDPTLLRSRGGLYLLYKRDGNAFRHPSIIYGQPLDPSGLQVELGRVVLLRSRPSGWEEGVAEGPSAVKLGRTTYLLYSGGIYLGPGYGEGEAVRKGALLGRYHRIGNGPVLTGHGHWVGTGGASIVHDGRGLLLAYNAFPATEHPAYRRLFVRPLRLIGKVLRPVGRATRIRLMA
jgi:hypothetical protein